VLLGALACESRGASSAAHAPPPGPSAELTAAIGSGEQVALARLPKGAEREIIVANCLVCHGASLITQQRKDSAAWVKSVTQMVTFGSPLGAEQQPALVRYLTREFGKAGQAGTTGKTAGSR
jgi:cytochrome c5